MANYDDLKKKAKDAFDTLADASAEALKNAEEKARILARRAVLNTEITREQGLIRRLKGELGKKYYTLHKDDPEEELKQECEGITDALARIAAKRKELEDLKTGASCCCDCEPECEPESKTECDAECEAKPEE